MEPDNTQAFKCSSGVGRRGFKTERNQNMRVCMYQSPFKQINHFSQEKDKKKKYFNVKFQSEQTPSDDSATKGLSQTSAGSNGTHRVCLRTLEHLRFPYPAFLCRTPTKYSKFFELNSYHIWWLDVYAKINIRLMGSGSLGYKSTCQSADWDNLKGSFAQQPQALRSLEIMQAS